MRTHQNQSDRAAYTRLSTKKAAKEAAFPCIATLI